MAEKRYIESVFINGRDVDIVLDDGSHLLGWTDVEAQGAYDGVANVTVRAVVGRPRKPDDGRSVSVRVPARSV